MREGENKLRMQVEKKKKGMKETVGMMQREEREKRSVGKKMDITDRMENEEL